MGRPGKKIVIGDKAHHLTVISEPFHKERPDGRSERWVEVKCDRDGNILDLRVTEFGRTTSCGCLKFAGAGAPRKYEFVEGYKQPGGRLTAVSETHKDGLRLVRCLCACGDTKEVRLDQFYREVVRSCGCYNSDVARANMAKRSMPTGEKAYGYKHGFSKHPSYKRWTDMMERCYNENNPSYPKYGGSGIRVYSPWHKPAEFCTWLDLNLGPCPEGQSLDRTDVYGNYEPGNVKWATPQEQARNTKWSHATWDENTKELKTVLRQRFPGHTQDWYAVYTKRAALAAAGIPESDLPELPEK